MTRFNLSIRHITISFFLSVLCSTLLTFVMIKYSKSKEVHYETLTNIARGNELLQQKMNAYTQRLWNGEKGINDKLTLIVKQYSQALQTLKNEPQISDEINSASPSSTNEGLSSPLVDLETTWLEYNNNLLTLLHDLSNNESQNQKSNEQIAEAHEIVKSQSTELKKRNEILIAALMAEYERAKDSFNAILFFLFVLNLAIVVIGYFLFKKFTLDRLESLARESENTTNGESKTRSIEYKDPTLKKISNSINELGDVISQSVQFADKLGSGNFEFEFKTSNGSNKLFDELSFMKEKLMKVSEEDEKRKWVTEGLASFAETLRSNEHDVKTLSDELLSELVKYLKANQGAIFMVSNDESGGEEYLELIAAYAWKRKKFLASKVAKGDGLVGECWIEGEMIYMTDVPKDFVKITSGLGTSNPNAIVIVPLKINGVIFGILELASFHKFEPFQLDFIVKLSENIAATLSNIKTGEETKRLLEASQEQTERLKSQEEEMQQNMEELTATQEIMIRKEKELTGLLEASMNNVKQNLNEIAIRIQSSIASGKKELKFLSHVPPIQGMIRALENGGVDPVDNSTYDIWLERFLVILEFLLDSKELYSSVQLVSRDRQICRVSFENGHTSKEKDKEIDTHDLIDRLNSMGDKEMFVFPPQQKDNTFTLRICTPVYYQGQYYGGLVINLLGDEIIQSVKAKQDEEYSYKLTSSEGSNLFYNKLYTIKSDIKTDVIINEREGYSFEITGMTKESHAEADYQTSFIKSKTKVQEVMNEPAYR